jgi:hypothetical protein
VITPYGLIKQPPSWERGPNEELAKLLQEERKQEELEPELDGYHGDYSLRVLEYCIREDPGEILERLFGIPDLKNIAKKLGLKAVKTIKDRSELIDLILLALGFNLPPKTVEGVVSYKKLLGDSERKIKKGETISAVMLEVFEGLERILRDLSYFYLNFLWNLESEDLEKRSGKVDRLIKELGVSEKPFLKLTLGEQVSLLRKLNEEIRRKETLKEKMEKEFNRNYILAKSHLKMLSETVSVRNTLVHPEGEKPSKESALELIAKLKNLVEELKRENRRIYPVLVQVKYEITNEYGTRYFEAEDEDQNIWTIKTNMWIDATKLYFMHSKTNPVAINPVLIEKVFLT